MSRYTERTDAVASRDTSDRANLPAIPARHHPLGDALVYWALVRPAIWSHFDRVWLRVEGPLPHPADGPLIIYFNHPSWWDGYMACIVNRVVLRDRFRPYLMMEEPELRRYQFFSWSGCFSVNRQDARAAARSVAYISRLLAERRDRALLIFPQGEITPNDRRPLAIFSGIAHVASRAGGAALLPVALRYEFRGEQRPEAFIRLGPFHIAPAPVEARALTREAERRLAAATDALRDELNDGRLERYRVLLRGRAGVNRVFDAARGLLPTRMSK
jgi:1-acyl-sn-glycerol-3-phosphate acyltransferase